MDLLRLLAIVTFWSSSGFLGLAEKCSLDQWQCHDGRCIAEAWRCDGVGDCAGGSDELDCACLLGQYMCRDGSGCMNRSLVCDGLAQCSDHSDETGCGGPAGCLLGDWQCQNKMCVLPDYVCDGKNDCLDNSDEDDCGLCGPSSVRCPNGVCLSSAQRCDGKAQCADGSDEPATCGHNCSQGNGGCSHTCIDAAWGASCSCPEGWKLSTDGTTCEDIDECAQPNGPCMQLCKNIPGSYSCHCAQGFQLVGNTSCRAEGNFPLILTSKNGAVGLLNPMNGKYRILGSINNLVGLAFDLGRNYYYLADDKGNIYKLENESSSLLYPGIVGVKSIACDWVSGQLYWSNQKAKAIQMGKADGSGFATVLAKKINPKDLVLLPTESAMFWINQRGNVVSSIEKAGMDGSRRTTLVVTTAQQPRALSLDVAAHQLYWISDSKKCIETVKIDGTGRLTFLGFFTGRPVLGLAVFGEWFYWSDTRQLWRTSRIDPRQKILVLRSPLSLLAVLHETQQPPGLLSICAESPCELCLPSLESPLGYTCTCPEGKVLIPSGKCENVKIAYATSESLYTLEFKEDNPVKVLVLTTDEDIQFFDINYKLEWVFWINGTGHVKAKSLYQDHSIYIPMLIQVCTVKVDPRFQNLYWLSCDGMNMGVTAVGQDGSSSSKLIYHTDSEIRDLFIDWLRDKLYWLENGQIFELRLSGGNAKKVSTLQEEVSQVSFDIKSNSFIWNSGDLQVMSLLKKTFSSLKGWNVTGLMAAQQPYLVSSLNNIITLWDRRDARRVRDVPVESGLVGLVVLNPVEDPIQSYGMESGKFSGPKVLSKTALPKVSTQAVSCNSPSYLCSGTSLCISQKQLCDGKLDCPDGSDEALCLETCVNPADFLCKDRRICVEETLVCDGHSNCYDGSDEVGCPTVSIPVSKAGPLKCRIGFIPCRDGKECVLYSHLCDGELDCKDGSDEDECIIQCETEQFRCAHGKKCINNGQVCDGIPQCQDHSDEMDCWKPTEACAYRCDGTRCIPEKFHCDGEKNCLDGTDEMDCDENITNSVPTPKEVTLCSSPSFMCHGTTLCISQTQLCDGKLDCPDGSDEAFCLKACVNPDDFLCKDKQTCVKGTLVCDGHSHCYDGSDEVGCPTVAVRLTDATPLKCRHGSQLCQDGSECVLHSHICDGELDCKDGSDEDDCVLQCRTGQFQCTHGKKCIDLAEVCDGVAQCQDKSDEMNCWRPTKSCAYRCDNNTHCIPETFRCDGERDCLDGTDETGCGTSKCNSPSVMCQRNSVCITQKQLCDGKLDCPDGSDEESCFETCEVPGEFLCKDQRNCIKISLVCDGHSHCYDDSDEVDCPTLAAKVSVATPLKCQRGSSPCRDGSECVFNNHLCDGELDCKDGSDEDNCILQCQTGQFQCRHGKRCIEVAEVCDGVPQCQDRSDELNCLKPSMNCVHHCDNKTRCIPESFRCDGEKDCLDGSDESGCGLVAVPTSGSSILATAQMALPCNSSFVLCQGGHFCISEKQLCDGKKDCPDGFDEEACLKQCADTDYLCEDGHTCISRKLICDGYIQCPGGSDETHCLDHPSCVMYCDHGTKCLSSQQYCNGAPDCQDGSDEKNCSFENADASAVDIPETKLKCRVGFQRCRDGSECVLYSHLCDGERDCRDGSDEEECVLQCQTGQFQCAHGKKCINIMQVCDGVPQCQDRSDELNCWRPTKSCAHRCDNKTFCIPETFRCDGERDCLDGTDEVGCGAPGISVNPETSRCNSSSVMCKGTSLCISHKQMCDGKLDCPDGSDETSCFEACVNPGDFLCKDKQACIKGILVCDGHIHCFDGSDEMGCSAATVTVSKVTPLKCRMGSAPCQDGSDCVPYSHLCDGEQDCKDGSDEDGCVLQCQTGQFQCTHGRKCIDLRQVCDGVAQCQDRSDEMDCWRPTKSCAHRCDNKTHCIPETFRCDGEQDCLDGTDEADCGNHGTLLPPPVPANPAVSLCNSPLVLCQKTSVCITQKQLCDGKLDCPDGSDESSCLDACIDPADFLCKDKRTCIKEMLVCDGHYHCYDGSDELGCPTATVAVSKVTPLKCRMGSIRCRDGTECIPYSHLCDGELDCRDGSDEDECVLQCQTEQFQCAHGKKCIEMVQVCDGVAQCQDKSDEMGCWTPTKSCAHRCDNDTHCIPETFLCDGEKDCLDGTDESSCVAEKCSLRAFRCRNGQCVNENMRCDGFVNCHDQSDEENCTKPPRCPSLRHCHNSHKCLLEQWLCDGEEDCRDGSDEENCQVSLVKCGRFQWSCASKTQCVPMTWRCDHMKDCDDGSDEDGCGQFCFPHQFQCMSGECLNPVLVCNGVMNCVDGSDEGTACFTYSCSSLNSPSCDQHCFSTPHGLRCRCDPGFQLQSDGLSCTDFNECEEPHMAACSHNCLNMRGSYLCVCQPGYLLEPDGHTCKSKDEPYLLASIRFELLFIGLRSGTMDILYSSDSKPVFAIDYDWGKQMVFWVSLEEESIRWISLNQQNKGTLVKGVKADCIAVDWIAQNLYWIDGTARQILAIHVDSSAKKLQDSVVVLDEDLVQPRSLVLFPLKGLMFWSEFGNRPQIESSGMDGSERKTVISSRISWPGNLAIDMLDERIYWTDEKLKCIGSSLLDGRNVKLLQLFETPSPFSVGVFNDMMFWSDAKRWSIQSAHKRTGKNRKVVLKHPGQPFELKVVHALQQANTSNPCAKHACSHFCLLGPGPVAVCRCPMGLLLGADGKTCSTPSETTFIMLLSPTAVTQIPLRGLHSPSLRAQWPAHHALQLPDMSKVLAVDLALADHVLFLADENRSSVTMFKLGKEGLQQSGTAVRLPAGDVVTAMAVDWVTLGLYWSSRQQPHIHATSGRGAFTAVLLADDLHSPVAIALDPPSGWLCFADLKQPDLRIQSQLECAFMDGRNRTLVWDRAVRPTSLSFSNEGTELYWADAGIGIISSIKIDGTRYREYKTGPGFIVSFACSDNVFFWITVNDTTKVWYSDHFLPKQLWFEVKTDVVALKVYGKSSQKGTSDCAVKNGGCSQLCLPFPGGRTCKCAQDHLLDTSCGPNPQCPPGTKPCQDGYKCLNILRFCDHVPDCLDHSDESNCLNVNPETAPSTGPHHSSPKSQPTDSSLRRNLDSQSCSAELCHGQGYCVTKGGDTHCECHAGYRGPFCQHQNSSSLGVLLALGFLALVCFAGLMFIFIRKRGILLRLRALEQSPEKQMLVTERKEHVSYAQCFPNELYDPREDAPPTTSD